MCIDSQSIIFILVLFKLGQIFSGPPQTPRASLSTTPSLVAKRPSDGEQRNKKRALNSDPLASRSTRADRKFVSSWFADE